ncbi:unnamed protein product [Cladocopium goreaui]|uniref:Cilia- and flagella-associated protein 77 n=2 Tax=Cladocopium goreaui TaxID=2562237 RepID=A0A9P1C7X5_9DINO|nr:unnamed protein product [Cladocopium goreaui]
MSQEYRRRVDNPVIVKDEVGKARHSCYDLPPDGHAYGRVFPRDPEGAREVTSRWTQHLKSVQPADLAQDFRAINKTAVKRGVRPLESGTAKQMNTFRRGVDIRLNPPRNEDGSTVVRRPVDRSATYGRANLPSTPMQDVLHGAFASDFESEMSQRYEAYAEHDALEAPGGKHRIRTTKAQALRVGARRLAEAPPRILRPKDPFRHLTPRLLLQPLSAREKSAPEELDASHEVAEGGPETDAPDLG